jgi:O-methyltransferase
LWNFCAAIEEVNRNNIPGDIIELGVWRGGAMLTATKLLDEQKSKRHLHLFDAFESIQGYTHEDFLAVSQERVKSSFEYFGLLSDRVHFHKGLFKDTVPAFRSDRPIAVLRVDGKWLSC